jgi:geranylgeranyl diphosphate synthase, type II
MKKKVNVGSISDFERYFSYLKEYINKKIISSVSRKEPKLLYDPSKYILQTGGKRIRGILVLLTGGLMDVEHKDSLNFAAAIEVLHLFTLVHDDIMDNATLRRGFKTIHTKWDTGTAILSGDFLVGLSYELLLKNKVDQIDKIAKVFTGALVEVCEGQAYDKDFESRSEINLKEYYNMIEKKTGKLFEASCIIGGLIGNCPEQQMKNLKNLGFSIGRAFQIKDDLLDITSSEDKIGKNVCHDIKENKKTYFYAVASEIFSRKDFLHLKNLYSLKKKDKKMITDVIELYNKYKIIDRADHEVQILIDRAKKSLRIFPESGRCMLESFADKMVMRKF